MKKGEMKQYLKDHKKEIALAVGGTLLLGAGVLVGWQGCKKIKFGNGLFLVENPNIAGCLTDAQLTYPDRFSLFTNTINDISCKDLGKLSERFEFDDVFTADHKFTHFILIGPELK